MPNVLRNIPSVNELLDRPPLKNLIDRANRTVVVSGVRDFLETLRNDVASAASEIPGPAELAERIAEWISTAETPRLRPVINATGILLHTGLGRAPLASEAIEAIDDLAHGYASLEVDLDDGKRSQRYQAVERLLCKLTGADAAVVVNNNAGATLLVLAAMAQGREVIVSRGQLVEIGGSYRLPDVMQAGGVVLREVGTTNKTRISDYESALGEETAALMKVHTSNYLIKGFTEQASLEELIALARKHHVPVIDDIGSGAMVDLSKYGIQNEPMASDSIKAGADLVLFSGDKLLGGPQCGIIIGKKDAVKKAIKHPLARALRVDKTTLAALAATLRLYQDPELAEQRVPFLSMLSTPIENLRHRAEHLAPQLASLSAVSAAEVCESEAFIGGGSVPTQRIATVCVALAPQDLSVDEFARALRMGTPSVFGRVQDEQLLLDLRTVFPEQDADLLSAVQSLAPITEADGEKETPDTPDSTGV